MDQEIKVSEKAEALISDYSEARCRHGEMFSVYVNSEERGEIKNALDESEKIDLQKREELLEYIGGLEQFQERQNYNVVERERIGIVFNHFIAEKGFDSTDGALARGLLKRILVDLGG